jgi:hypothetical protein
MMGTFSTGEMDAEVMRDWEQAYHDYFKGRYSTTTKLIAEDSEAFAIKNAARRRWLLPPAGDLTNQWILARQSDMATEFIKGARLSAGRSLSFFTSQAMGPDLALSTGAGYQARVALMGEMIGARPIWVESGLVRYSEAIQKGKTAEQALAAFAREMKTRRNERKTTFATNEVTSAHNAAIRASFDRAIKDGTAFPERLLKEWWTAGDEDVCPICEPLDKTVVGFEGIFSDNPRNRFQTFQEPPLHVRCRCVIQYVMEPTGLDDLKKAA